VDSVVVVLRAAVVDAGAGASAVVSGGSVGVAPVDDRTLGPSVQADASTAAASTAHPRNATFLDSTY